MRVISPPSLTEEITGYLSEATGVTNLAVLPGAARRPAGDLLICDVAREAANDVIARLKEFRLDSVGSIAVERVDLSVSEVAEQAREEAPGESDDAVIWEELADRAASESRTTWAFLAFMAIAVQLVAIAVVVDSTVLIVGAMVLGPEFGAVTAICFGLLGRRWGLIGSSLRTLLVGFAFGIAVTFACAFVSRGLGWLDPGMLSEREAVQFIVKPDRWSFIVAVLAGAAGVLSITAGKSSPLVGVFISVTTVPAAGYVALAVALGDWDDVGGSLAQLAMNIAAMAVAGTATLYIQRFLWSRYGRSAPQRLRSTLMTETRPRG
ncbi:DUF389 domain-containing protein [Microtetraspora sp. NBRC 13810]|uniref:DUF389 domain-containing protein n=1 Tax=Microtetraspora sp. NBRC 13810 TaxID=3030990 RepID=UPI002555AB7C|nr:DUF389 domain-containing protein [Microtetraspora sp. NBRC 13810]